MKRNAFLILLLIVVNISVCIPTVVGQTTLEASITGRFLKFSLPIVHNQVKDNLVAPIRWNGTGSGLGFSCQITGSKIIHEVCLVVNVSGLKNRYNFKGFNLEASLGYSLTYKLIQGVLGGIIYLGPQIKYDSKINFLRDWDDSHFYWLNTYEVGPSMKWIKYCKEKQAVSLAMEIPFFAFISRPPENQYIDQPPLIKPFYYFTSMNEDLRFVTLNNFHSIRLQVDYSYQFKSGNMIGGTWFFDFKECKLPRNTTIITNTLMITYYKLFGKKY
jgi:hypothetical protein